MMKRFYLITFYWLLFFVYTDIIIVVGPGGKIVKLDFLLFFKITIDNPVEYCMNRFKLETFHRHALVGDNNSDFIV